MTKRILALLLGVVMLFTITVSATSGGADRAYDTKADAVYGGSSSDTRDDLSGGSQSGAQDALTPEQPAVPDDSADPDPLPSVTPDQPYVPLPDTTTTCACPDGVHLEGCPLYAAPAYDRLMAAQTAEEFEAIAAQYSAEELVFTPEEFDALDAHYYWLCNGIEIDRSPVVYEESCSVNYTNVAPIETEK